MREEKGEISDLQVGMSDILLSKCFSVPSVFSVVKSSYSSEFKVAVPGSGRIVICLTCDVAHNP